MKLGKHENKKFTWIKKSNNFMKLKCNPNQSIPLKKGDPFGITYVLPWLTLFSSISNMSINSSSRIISFLDQFQLFSQHAYIFSLYYNSGAAIWNHKINVP